MALARKKSVDHLRYCPPGEWGKFMGLDRIPEVRTLREKIGLLTADNRPTDWSAELCRNWMSDVPEEAGVLYVDGHVRVYHGEMAHLPRRYVARQKLCLRGTTDYWVNAMDGKPFFVIQKPIDPKLVQVLEKDIVPRLLAEVPHQPTSTELEADKFLHRFTVVFDREGYSPELLLNLRNQRVACITYHKNPGENWAESEFLECPVELVSGEVVTMRLAERGTWLGKKLWVREIRRLTATGHQTSVLSTDYGSDKDRIAPAMFGRWSQENYFKYMRENFGIDRLVQYGAEKIPDTQTNVINPEYRRLDGEIRKERGVLNRKLAQFAGMNLTGEIDPKTVEAFEEKKGVLNEEIRNIERTIEEMKAKRKTVARHITLGELPEKERFTRLTVQSKHLVDTIKMIAYRAETAMAQTLREKMSRNQDTRTLLKAIYSAEADLVPDEKEGTLTVRLHHLANRTSDEAVRYLCEELNQTETIFPDSSLRLIYEFVPSR